MEDNASAFCLLCVQNFTYSNRRHHCRVCGVLCCDSCSSKRLKIHVDESMPQSATTSPKAPSSSATGKKTLNGIRVCDSCFNRLCADSFNRHLDIMRTKKELERRLEEERREREMTVTSSLDGKSSPMNTASTLFGWSTSPHSPSKSLNKDDKTKIIHSVNEAALALEERGQRLNQTLERSEQMNDVSETFCGLRICSYLRVLFLGCISISFNGQASIGKAKKDLYLVIHYPE